MHSGSRTAAIAAVDFVIVVASTRGVARVRIGTLCVARVAACRSCGFVRAGCCTATAGAQIVAILAGNDTAIAPQKVDRQNDRLKNLALPTSSVWVSSTLMLQTPAAPSPSMALRALSGVKLPEYGAPAAPIAPSMPSSSISRAGVVFTVFTVCAREEHFRAQRRDHTDVQVAVIRVGDINTNVDISNGPPLFRSARST